MLHHVFFLLSILVTAATAQQVEPDIEHLAAAVDGAASKLAPHQVFDIPEAERLVAFVYTDLKTNQGLEVTRLFRRHEVHRPSWQVVAEAVERHYSNPAPQSTDAATLVAVFSATIKPGDHWMNYDAPRGWKSAFSLRGRLANLIVYAKTGKQADHIDKKLLLTDPISWLRLNAGPTSITPQDSSATKPKAPGRTPLQPVAATKSGESLPRLQPQSDESAQVPSWIPKVVLILACLSSLWFALKPRSSA